jgi:hypothetical protein
VDPVQPARHPGASLIEVRHRRGGQLRSDDLGEPVQPSGALDEHSGQRAGGQRCSQQVAQQSRGPVHRQVLVHQQVAAKRPHPRPVAGRGTSLGGEPSLGRGPTGALASLDPMLTHQQPQRWQVEHLPGLDPDHDRTGQLGAAPLAAARHMLDHLVGLGDLGQMGTGRAGLLARRAAALGLLGTAL